ncbi:MAG TPA: redoxin domain-containing protein [Gemmatimonadaceae bacterium]|nr:redoxin domain-containing protein [Gemmatimonadaceae bacterium]
MSLSASHTITVASFLPYLELPSAPDGLGVSLRRRGREATVLVQVHGPTCPDCRRYLSELATAAGDLASWDGRVVAIVPGSLDEASAVRAELRLPFAVLSDAVGRSPLADGTAVVVADRYGHVYFVTETGAGHALPTPRELEEWLTYLATQCPE